MNSQRQFESVKRHFTEKELSDLHNELVVRVGEVKVLRGNRTEYLTEANASIKTAEKQVWDLQDALAKGYELAEAEVMWALDTPRAGMKTLIRVDNSEELRTEPMTPQERQRTLFREGDEE